MSKKLQKYCRIFQWVEANDDAFARAIHDLCMEGALSAGRRSGTTFLFPSADLRKEVVKKAYSKEPEEAIRLLEAHILSGVARTANDFRDLGSKLGIKIELESGAGSKATLKGGAQREVAADFVPLRKDNIMVWKVVSGAVPLEGPAFEMARRGRGEPLAVKTGGCEYSAKDRRQLARTVELAFDHCMQKDRCQTADPYLTHTVSLLNFVKQNHPATLPAVLALVDRDPAVTFYLLVEPYKSAGSDYVLRDEVLFGPSGWNGAEVYQSAVTEYQSYFNALAAQQTFTAEDRASGNSVVPLAFRDSSFVRTAVDNVRMQIIGEDGRKANKIQTPKLVREAYAALASGNKIADAQPILPDETLSLVPGAKKLWQDELRFVLHAAMMELRRAPRYEPQQFTEILEVLRFIRPGNDYGAEAQLSNAELLQGNVNAQSDFLLLLKFINSSDFLYVPVSDEKVGGDWRDIPVTEDLYDPSDLRVYNAEASKHRHLESLRARGLDAHRGLSPGAIAAIRQYVATHGSLPPELGVVEAVRV